MLVGMSGGVDSSVAALLLRRQGCRVAGITMKTWRGTSDRRCSGRPACIGPGEGADAEKAATICEKLGMPHSVVDLSAEFEEAVLSGFRSDYSSGLTPNPCVICNRAIKFGSLWAKASSAGEFDLFATGHYARIVHGEPPARHRLLMGLDRMKDQSYFLGLLTQDQLGRTLLPLGGLTKAEVRGIAREAGWIDLADSRESQDLAEGGGYAGLLRQDAQRPGPVVNPDGCVIGTHKGTAFFTIGQRKGLGIGGLKRPLFVTRLDPSSSTVFVGPRELLLSTGLRASEMNWVAWEDPPREFEARARIRSRHEPAAARVTVSNDGDSVEMMFDEPQSAVTPGQLVVLYDCESVLGAGRITGAAGQQGLP